MQVGSLVECIDDNFDYERPTMRFHYLLPIKNKIYTIRDIFKGTQGGVGIHLEEIKSKINPSVGMEQGFNINRFRELMPSMSISIESLIHQEA